MAKAKKLPSGNYRVQAYKTVNGKKIKKSFTAATKREAELSAYDWQNNNYNDEKIQSLTLEEAYSAYISAKENVLSASTIKAYKSLKKNTFNELMPLEVKNITSLMIQESVSKFAIEHSPKCTRNAYSLLLSSVNMFFPEKKYNITLPKKIKTEMYIPDDNDIKKLLDAANQTRMEIPILLAAFGPMRRGEICALTDKDIIGNRVSITKSLVLNDKNKWELKSPKTYSSYRTIELPDFVIDKIKNIKGKITDMTPSAITNAFPVILQKAGLPKFRFHDLRHYSVSTLHAQNIPDKYIMARGGWQTNYTMNNVYNHTIKNATDETEQRITEHFTSVFNSK